MNHLVLQKLLHSHSLFIKDKEKFEKTFVNASHIANHKTERVVGANVFKGFLDYHTKRIQQAMKFYMPLETNLDNHLTEEEVLKLQEDLDYFLPYKSTFIQTESEVKLSEEELKQIIGLGPDQNILDDQDLRALSGKNLEKPKKATYNVYIEDTESTDDEGSAIYRGNIFIHFDDTDEFYYDPNDYYYSFRDKNEFSGYTFWLPEESSFYEYTDTGSDTHGGMYNNASLNNFVGMILNVHCRLCLMLTYPQITNTSSVKGITKENAKLVPLSKKFSVSELRAKPKYEHKVLKLDLFGTTGGDCKSTGNSEGRAFHAVRKHIRRYRDGKISFVKAHFRGNKDIGIVTKDYEIVNKAH